MLLIGICAVYVVYVVWLFIYVGWRMALFAALGVILIQCLRLVAHEIDRIGWRLRQSTESSENASEVLQKRLATLVVCMTYVLNLGLLAHAYWVTNWVWTIGLAGLLGFIELSFVFVRRVNRKINYDSPVYGTQDSMLLGSHSNRAASGLDLRMQKLDAKLEVLNALKNEGKISAEAYRKALDQYRVTETMRDD